MEQLLAIRDSIQRLEFEEDNSVMELRLLVLSAMSQTIRLHLVCPDARRRTIYKDAFRIMKYNYRIIAAAQNGDAYLFGSARAKALNAMDGLMMQLCVLEARTAGTVMVNGVHGEPRQLRIA